MKSVAGTLKLELAQFRELEAFMQFASDLDEDTKVRIESGRKYTELLKQDQHATLPFFKQVVSLYAANNAIFVGAAVESVRAIESALFEMIERDRNEIFTAIEKERAISDETEALLKTTLEDFKTSHPQFYTAA
jgi:F-type H+-transporting ATPase subunit alpha